MTDNEKAAIAAGLWEPIINTSNHSRCDRCRAGNLSDHGAVSYAPNMHDPANLWRALEAKRPDIGYRGPEAFENGIGRWYCDLDLEPDGELSTFGATPVEALFAALVALYDAEHPTNE